MQVFLSYRRSDVGGHAGRLRDELTRRLGRKSVFQDVATIVPGEDFLAAIDRALDAADVVLAVIGPGWLSASTPAGARRLTDPGDYVRTELARALKRDIRVVPVLVGGSSLPLVGELPDDLFGLVQRQAVVLDDDTWHSDVDRLVRYLRGKPPVPDRQGRRRRLAAAGAGGILLTVAGAAAWQQRAGDEPKDPRPRCPAATGPGWTPVALNRNPSGMVTVSDGSLTFTVRSARWKRIETAMWQVILTTEMANSTPASRYHYADRYRYLAVARRENAPTCFSSTPDQVEANKIGDATIGFTVTCPPTGYLELGLNGDGDNVGAVDVTPKTSPSRC